MNFMSERFFRSNRPGYPHPVSSELENSGIRVAVGDCSVTERRRKRPPYQTGKTVLHVHAKHYKHNEDGRTAPGVCGNGSVPLSHSGNVVTRTGIHTHMIFDILQCSKVYKTSSACDVSINVSLQTHIQRKREREFFFIINRLSFSVVETDTFPRSHAVLRILNEAF